MTTDSWGYGVQGCGTCLKDPNKTTALQDSLAIKTENNILLLA